MHHGTEYNQHPRGPRWGWILNIDEIQGRVRSGVLYPILHRMLEQGWVTDGWEEPSDTHGKRPPRRYYELTPDGRAAMWEMLRAMEAENRYGVELGVLGA